MSFVGCEETQRLRQMRFVNHFAVELYRTCATSLSESIDDALRVLQLLRRGGKACVDDGHLVRVNSEFSAKALTTCPLYIGLQAIKVAEIHIQSVNRLHACMRGSQQTQGTR